MTYLAVILAFLLGGVAGFIWGHALAARIYQHGVVALLAEFQSYLEAFEAEVGNRHDPPPGH